MTEGEIIKQIRELNRDTTSTNWDERTGGGAPHKPFLLLSIMDGIEDGRIGDNRIRLDQELIETFFTYWNAVMGEERKTTIALPFYHMQSEPFWGLVYRQGKDEYRTSPSLGGLKDRVEYALLNPDLFERLSDPGKRNQYRLLLLEHYFDDETARKVEELGTMQRQAFEYSRKLSSIAAEPFQKYHAEGEKQTTTVTRQVRDEGFRIAVRSAYNHTCAFCRSRVITPEGHSLVQGAHIIPRRLSFNDDPRNGLALCGTHHWLFDAYMVTVSDSYEIVISGWLKKEGNHIPKMTGREGQALSLPEEEGLYPSMEALGEHRERFGEVNG